MWFKILWGQLKTVFTALLPWLKTEAAKFAAELLPDAKQIVAEVAKKDGLSNREKFELAAKTLRQRAIDLGYDYKDRYVNQLVEIAYGLFKENK
jgi:hypothetical protein